MDIYQFVSEVQAALAEAVEEAIWAAYEHGYIEGLDVAQVVNETFKQEMCPCGCGLTTEEAEEDEDYLDNFNNDEGAAEPDPLELLQMRVEYLEDHAGLKYTGPSQ